MDIERLPQSQQLMQATDIQEEEIKISISLPYIEGTSENYGVYSDLIKLDRLSTLK